MGFALCVGLGAWHPGRVEAQDLHLTPRVPLHLVAMTLSAAPEMTSPREASALQRRPDGVAVASATANVTASRRLRSWASHHRRSPCSSERATPQSEVDLQGEGFEPPEGFIVHFLNTELGEIVAQIPVLPMATLGGISLEAEVLF